MVKTHNEKKTVIAFCLGAANWQTASATTITIMGNRIASADRLHATFDTTLIRRPFCFEYTCNCDISLKHFRIALQSFLLRYDQKAFIKKKGFYTLRKSFRLKRKKKTNIVFDESPHQMLNPISVNFR